MEKLAIIGGSGLYHIDDLEITGDHDIDTPFGKPSAPIAEGRFENSSSILFLPRHGAQHSLLPSEINYRANIWALKKLGARRIASFSAVGSLREKIRPTEMAVISQYFDHTRGQRQYSFFGQGVVAHISTAQPVCNTLSEDMIRAADNAGLKLHNNTTYACVEGPRLGTQAESHFLRQANCDVVGMTNVPECFLAREAQMAYCSVGIVTDYDCWQDDADKHAKADEIITLYMDNIEKVKSLIKSLASSELSPTPGWISNCLQYSIITPPDNISNENKKWLSVLQI